MTRRLWLVLGAIMIAAVAFGALNNMGRTLASTFQFTSVPSTVSYQGFLNDGSGNPVTGTVSLDFSIWDASTGGTQVWNETHGSVMIDDGFFSVLLGGQGMPLSASVFSGTPRYLEVTYNGTTFPRQVFSTVPYAFVASQATQALNATQAVSATQAVTATYAYTAAYAMSSGGSSGGSVDWAQVVVVAKSGGDYTSVVDAMAAISPTSENRYLVLVMPGVYQGPVTVKPYVHVKGMGVETTYIESAANSSNYFDDEAATLLLPANSQLSNLTVRNTGDVNQSTALSVDSGNSATRVTHVRAVNTGASGQRHVAVYLSGQATLEHVYASVPGNATVSNWALYSNAATFTARNSQFYAQGSDLVNAIRLNGGTRVEITDSILDATTSGTGLSAQNVPVYVDRSTIVGGSVAGANGVSATNNAKIYIGASKVTGNFVAATGGAPQTEIKCVQSYNGDYNEITNSATSCS